MLDYFQRLGYVCPTHTNPADYALDLIAIDLRSPEVERASYKRLAKLTAQYRDAQQQQQRDLLDPSTAQAAQQQYSKEARDHIFNQMKQQHVNAIVQMLVLVARAFKNIVRDKMVIMVRLIEALLMGVCVVRALVPPMGLLPTRPHSRVRRCVCGVLHRAAYSIRWTPTTSHPFAVGPPRCTPSFRCSLT
jgi:hypothetical protein